MSITDDMGFIMTRILALRRLLGRPPYKAWRARPDWSDMRWMRTLLRWESLLEAEVRLTRDEAQD